MDVADVAEKIKKKIELLEKARGELRGYAEDKALSIALYDKELAIITIKLIAGKPMELEDEVIGKVPATVMEKVAKGLAWEARQQMELAAAQYKLATSTLESISAELNGYQTIFRHLSEV